MRLIFSNSRPSSLHLRPSKSQSGVALVVTVIMISVITFLTVAFLALSGREKNSVKTSTAQTTARLAADEATARAQTEILAAIIASGKTANFDLLVSTNYINEFGFDPAAVDQTTNVNYDYRIGGAPLNLNDARQNVANLLYSPRPPVYIETNAVTGASEFRYYLDLNRNRRHDPSGFRPVISPFVANPFFDTNGNAIPSIIPGSTVSNFVIGDPEWIGGLNRPQQSHSSSNRFQYRYAYIVVPEGKTLDVNYIHNLTQSGFGRPAVNGTDFFRNQGVGTWEINLAAFLHDLNTNAFYGWDGYVYTNDVQPDAIRVRGNSFLDAASLYRYRINGDPTDASYLSSPTKGLASFSGLFGNNAAGVYERDNLDGYSDGTPQQRPQVAVNSAVENFPSDDTKLPWAGAPQRNKFFTSQDFFDPLKVDSQRTPPINRVRFTDRLAWSATNQSTYDRYTFYRMLAQIGTDSLPEEDDKLNLNYVNVGGLKATNFISWTDPDLAAGNNSRGIPAYGVPGSVLFFTNAVDRMLRTYSAQWKNDDFVSYTNTFGFTNNLSMTNLPVWFNNRMVYTPSLHRILQLAANVFDSGTNRLYPGGANVAFPTVFRPLFRIDNANSNVFINGFIEVTNATSVLNARLRDPLSSPDLLPDDILFGVPLVIGAKKGFPNFNEFSMQNVFEITRKLQVRRTDLTDSGRPIQTNMMYVIGVSNAFGAELWNSYVATNRRTMDIYITNFMTAALTNSDRGTSSVWFTNNISGRFNSLSNWSGYNFRLAPDKQPSLVVALNTNTTILESSAYNLDTRSMQPLRDVAGGFLLSGQTANPRFPNPQWGLWITNRLQCAIVDRESGRIVDYVVLRGMDCIRDLSEDIRDPDFTTGVKGLWSTNLIKNQPNGLQQGVLNQLKISSGLMPSSDEDWKNYGTRGVSKDFAIRYFSKFNNDLGPADTSSIRLTNIVVQVPYSPTKRIARFYSWQANDPFVHYMADDLKDPQNFDPEKIDLVKIVVNRGVADATKGGIGTINRRYSPWGGPPTKGSDNDPVAFAPQVKDPDITSADKWEFMTNKFPNLGWLGRVHRGTPWQTIYLKSSLVDLATWTNWASTAVYVTNGLAFADAVRTLPFYDRSLLDVFTTSINENASRGRLSINQTNLASWSALFSGIVTLTNISSEQALLDGLPAQFAPLVIQPAGIYDAFNTNAWPQIVNLVSGINRTRADTNLFRNASFGRLGDILAVPQLTDASPFLNVPAGSLTAQRGINDAAYEWLPQQIMSLLQGGNNPRFTIYSYGQALQPAPDSVVTVGGPFFNLCTNYAITAEQVTRTVVEVEGGPNNPRLRIKSFNIVGPE